MKIAITGANGFVGSTLCKHFLNRGFEVTAIVRKTASLSNLPQEVMIARPDYSDVNQLTELFTDCNAVIHNAGKTKARTHSEMLAANLGITEKIIKSVNQVTSPLHLIYISSQAVAGPIKGKQPLSESDPPNPLTSYGKSKLEAEKAIRENCQKPWTIVRPCSVYGAGDKDFLALFKMVRKGLAVQIGSVDKPLNMIHVNQLAQFLELCVLNPAAQNQILYATDGNIYTQSQVVASIAKAFGKKPLRIVIPDPLARMVFYVSDLFGRLSKREVLLNREKMKEIMAPGWLASPDKARDLLDWRPEAQLNERIKETAECYQKLGWL